MTHMSWDAMRKTDKLYSGAHTNTNTLPLPTGMFWQQHRCGAGCRSGLVTAHGYFSLTPFDDVDTSMESENVITNVCLCIIVLTHFLYLFTMETLSGQLACFDMTCTQGLINVLANRKNENIYFFVFKQKHNLHFSFLKHQ